jgi:hypothetical protein
MAGTRWPGSSTGRSLAITPQKSFVFAAPKTHTQVQGKQVGECAQAHAVKAAATPTTFNKETHGSAISNP